MELDDSPNESDWDSEAMYNLDKFEGDIANKVNFNFESNPWKIFKD